MLIVPRHVEIAPWPVPVMLGNGVDHPRVIDLVFARMVPDRKVIVQKVPDLVFARMVPGRKVIVQKVPDLARKAQSKDFACCVNVLLPVRNVARK